VPTTTFLQLLLLLLLQLLHLLLPLLLLRVANTLLQRPAMSGRLRLLLLLLLLLLCRCCCLHVLVRGLQVMPRHTTTRRFK
jgi:hypothetical protein